MSGSELRLGVVLRQSDTLCGGVGLRIEAEHRRVELGYWIGVPYWGNGYATEASRALVDYGFGPRLVFDLEGDFIRAARTRYPLQP